MVGRRGSFFIRVIIRMFFSDKLALASLLPMSTVIASGCRSITESSKAPQHVVSQIAVHPGVGEPHGAAEVTCAPSIST